MKEDKKDFVKPAITLCLLITSAGLIVWKMGFLYFLEIIAVLGVFYFLYFKKDNNDKKN